MRKLYSKFKVFHYKDKIESLPREADNIMPPVHIRIKPTNVCGHSCWYCAYRKDSLQLGEGMNERDFIPREKMLEIIEDISEMGVQAVTFSGGGDPFYYKYLPDAVRKLSDTNVHFASLTNGSRLVGEVAEIFAHHGTWIRVSMDGWDDVSYAQYRGVKEGEFTRVMENIAGFKKLGGKCYLSVVLIVDQKNAPHVYDSIIRLRDIGINSVKVSPCITSNDMKESDEYHKAIFGLVRDQVDRAIAGAASETFEIFDSYHALSWKFEKDYDWCPYIQTLTIIGADMNVYTCQDKAYTKDGLLGSIRNQRFRDFWFSDKNVFFKTNPSRVCNHHCVVNERNNLILDYLSLDKEHLPFI